MKAFKLPSDFLMGSATAGAQIEGGITKSNWYKWCIDGHIKDGSTCIRANDHWNRYSEDIGWMKILNQQVYRMSVEWSRIEPRKGEFDQDAIFHYRDEITELIRNGIRPLVTLHHFSHPLWLVEEGEFENEKVVELFERYVTYVVSNLGDLVSEYITINEPNVYGVLGYYFGEWPPGKKDIKLVMKVFRNMVLCHIRAYQAIHRIRQQSRFSGETKVGIANALRVFHPLSARNPFNILAARIMDYLFQEALVLSMADGKLRFPIGKGAPLGTGKYYDFIGINYYTRSAVQCKGFRSTFFTQNPRNDLGWEIYPDGLSQICKRYYEKLKAPIWITENGTCDKKDAFRARFIYDHLYEVSRLCSEGIPVQRYYHWTLMDNFEWAEGESAPFGLIRVNFETQQRTLQRSGSFYAEVCREKGVTDNMIRKYFGST